MEYKKAALAISSVRIAASGRGRTVAWCAPLRRQTWRFDVVRRPLPRNVPALLTRRVGGLLRLNLLQHGRQPLVVDDRPRIRSFASSSMDCANSAIRPAATSS